MQHTTTEITEIAVFPSRCYFMSLFCQFLKVDKVVASLVRLDETQLRWGWRSRKNIQEIGDNVGKVSGIRAEASEAH